MKKVQAIVASAIVSVASFAAVAMPAHAAITKDTNTDACYIKAQTPITDIKDTNKNFTYNADGTVTAHFVVGGTDANCKKDASLAVWKAPTGKQYPLTDQVFYSSATKTSLSKGSYTLTAKLPCNFWQIDLVEGADPKGIDVTANYGELFSSNKAHMLDTNFGQNVCTETVVEKPVEVTKTVTKNVPVTVTKTVTAAAPVSSVPSTGADAGSVLMGTMGLSTSTGLAYNLIRKRKLLQ